MEVSLRTGEERHTVAEAISTALEQSFPEALADAMDDTGLGVSIDVTDVADEGDTDDDEDYDNEEDD